MTGVTNYDEMQSPRAIDCLLRITVLPHSHYSFHLLIDGLLYIRGEARDVFIGDISPQLDRTSKETGEGRRSRQNAHMTAAIVNTISPCSCSHHFPRTDGTPTLATAHCQRHPNDICNIRESRPAHFKLTSKHSTNHVSCPIRV